MITQLTYFNFKKEILDAGTPVAVLCISDEDRKAVPRFEELTRMLPGKIRFAILNITTAPKLAEQHSAKPSAIMVFSNGIVAERLPASMPAAMLKARLSAFADTFYAKSIRTFK